MYICVNKCLFIQKVCNGMPEDAWLELFPEKRLSKKEKKIKMLTKKKKLCLLLKSQRAKLKFLMSFFALKVAKEEAVAARQSKSFVSCCVPLLLLHRLLYYSTFLHSATDFFSSSTSASCFQFQTENIIFWLLSVEKPRHLLLSTDKDIFLLSQKLRTNDSLYLCLSLI